MTIETSITVLAEAMNALAAAINAHNDITKSHTEWLAKDDYVKPAPKKRGRKKVNTEESSGDATVSEDLTSAKADAPEAPQPDVAESTPAEAEDVLPAPVPASPHEQRKALRALLNEIMLAEGKGREVAAALVKRHSETAALSGIPDNRLMDAITAAKATLEGEAA